jgi:hypothetical protein
MFSESVKSVAAQEEKLALQPTIQALQQHFETICNKSNSKVVAAFYIDHVQALLVHFNSYLSIPAIDNAFQMLYGNSQDKGSWQQESKASSTVVQEGYANLLKLYHLYFVLAFLQKMPTPQIPKFVNQILLTREEKTEEVITEEVTAETDYKKIEPLSLFSQLPQPDSVLIQEITDFNRELSDNSINFPEAIPPSENPLLALVQEENNFVLFKKKLVLFAARRHTLEQKKHEYFHENVKKIISELGSEQKQLLDNAVERVLQKTFRFKKISEGRKVNIENRGKNEEKYNLILSPITFLEALTAKQLEQIGYKNTLLKWRQSYRITSWLIDSAKILQKKTIGYKEYIGEQRDAARENFRSHEKVYETAISHVKQGWIVEQLNKQETALTLKATGVELQQKEQQLNAAWRTLTEQKQQSFLEPWQKIKESSVLTNDIKAMNSIFMRLDQFNLQVDKDRYELLEQLSDFSWSQSRCNTIRKEINVVFAPLLHEVNAFNTQLKQQFIGQQYQLYRDRFESMQKNTHSVVEKQLAANQLETEMRELSLLFAITLPKYKKLIEEVNYYGSLCQTTRVEHIMDAFEVYLAQNAKKTPGSGYREIQILKKKFEQEVVLELQDIEVKSPSCTPKLVRDRAISFAQTLDEHSAARGREGIERRKEQKLFRQQQRRAAVSALPPPANPAAENTPKYCVWCAVLWTIFVPIIGFFIYEWWHQRQCRLSRENRPASSAQPPLTPLVTSSYLNNALSSLINSESYSPSSTRSSHFDTLFNEGQVVFHVYQPGKSSQSLKRKALIKSHSNFENQLPTSIRSTH